MNEKDPMLPDMTRMGSEFSESSDNRTLEAIKDQIGDFGKLGKSEMRMNRSGSVYVPPRVSEYVYERSK